MKKSSKEKNLDLFLNCLKKSEENINEMENAELLIKKLDDDEIAYLYESRLIEFFARQMRRYNKQKTEG